MMHRLPFAALALCATCAAASADVEVYFGSFGPASTDWTTSFVAPKFDTMGGTRVLDEVEFFLQGKVSGSAAAENTGSAANVTLDLTSRISFIFGGMDLVVVLPLVSNLFSASDFDDVIDFGGTSGVTYSELNQSEQGALHLTNPVDFAPFMGVGDLKFDVDALGESNASGGGNLITSFQTSAEAFYKVGYAFHFVPAPAGAGLFGLASLAGLRRRR